MPAPKASQGWEARWGLKVFRVSESRPGAPTPETVKVILGQPMLKGDEGWRGRLQKRW